MAATILTTQSRDSPYPIFPLGPPEPRRLPAPPRGLPLSPIEVQPILVPPGGYQAEQSVVLSPSSLPSSPTVKRLSFEQARTQRLSVDGRSPTGTLNFDPPPDRPERPKQWTHDTSRPHFLPPANSAPAALALLSTSLEVVREYREFVDALGKLEAEYGRALAAAVRKFETRLEVIHSPPPGGRKPPPPSLTAGMRRHLNELGAVAQLYQRRPGNLGSQIATPLSSLDRHTAETARRMAAWGKDVRARWDTGRERVDAARVKHDAAVREHVGAIAKLKACATPEGSGVNSEWVKLERAAAEAEQNRADRKRAYVVALAGEGINGGGGRDVAEGGGETGWGEEARELYAHVQERMLELLKHQADEDCAHFGLVQGIFKRACTSYDLVDLTKDQDEFLMYNALRSSPAPSSPVTRTTSRLGSTDGDIQLGIESSDSTSRSASLLSHSTALTTPPTSSTSLAPIHPSLICHEWVAAPWKKDETPDLSTEKRIDRNWLVNCWLRSEAALRELENEDGGGVLAMKRIELAKVRTLCRNYAHNRGLGDPDQLWERRIAVQRDLGIVERRAAVAKAEMACIEAVLGPQPMPELAHDFKDRTYTAPSTCDACKQRVFSPIKPELSCRLCGMALHARCALHVDPECTGLKCRRASGGQGRIRRSITVMKFRRSGVYDPPSGGPQEYRGAPPHVQLYPLRDEEAHISPFVAPEPEADENRPAIVAALDDEVAAEHGVSAEGSLVPLARVCVPYPAGGPLELSLAFGEVVRLIEPDLDGSGWCRVRRGLDEGDEGLVPVNCLGIVGQATPPLDGGVGKFVRAVFDFPPPSHELGEGQVEIVRHSLYELSDEGMAYDDMWCEILVPSNGGRQKGVVPKSYVSVM